MMKKTLLAMLLLGPSLAMAHSMTPGYEVHGTLGRVFPMEYTLKNNYDFPAVFELEVFNKDYTPADGWRAPKTEFKLNPGSERKINLDIRVESQRKLLVCTTLKEKGREGEKTSIISRVCSRLVVNGAR
jgi:hypothetical protein